MRLDKVPNALMTTSQKDKMTKDLSLLLQDPNLSDPHKAIVQKVQDNQRVSFEEGVFLFEKGELAFLGTLANFVRERKNGDRTFFNRNFHIEPTNLCVMIANSVPIPA